LTRVFLNKKYKNSKEKYKNKKKIEIININIYIKKKNWVVLGVVSATSVG
jgi:hypothetical protein